jgi:hypothetical protein
MPKWTQMADFWINLPDQPGELARLASRLREADVNLLGLWGYGAENGHARFYCVPESAEQFRNFAKSAEIEIREGVTFYLAEANRGGALVQTLEKIAKAGINLLAIQAVAIEDAFGCFLWADPKDQAALMKVLQ